MDFLGPLPCLTLKTFQAYCLLPLAEVKNWSVAVCRLADRGTPPNSWPRKPSQHENTILTPSILALAVFSPGTSAVACRQGRISSSSWSTTWASPTSAATAARSRRPISTGSRREGFASRSLTTRRGAAPRGRRLLTGLYSHQAGMGWLDNRVEAKSRGIHGRLLPSA